MPLNKPWAQVHWHGAFFPQPLTPHLFIFTEVLQIVCLGDRIWQRRTSDCTPLEQIFI